MITNKKDVVILNYIQVLGIDHNIVQKLVIVIVINLLKDLNDNFLVVDLIVLIKI